MKPGFLTLLALFVLPLISQAQKKKDTFPEHKKTGMPFS